MKKLRLVLNICVFCLVIGALSAAFVLMPDGKISVAERRPLKQFDEVKNAENPFEEIEGYYLDQFPFRDSFRALKAFLYNDVFFKMDNNKIYQYGLSVIKIEDKLDEAQVEYAADNINKVIDRLLDDTNNVYLSIIPDKHYFAAQPSGRPSLDYEKLIGLVTDKVQGAEYIDITQLLELSDYYKTDSHWSQDKIVDVAEALVSEMNAGATVTPEEGFEVKTLSPFYGVYFGQAAISLEPDEIKYLTSSGMSESVMTVINDMGKPETYPVYTTDMFTNVDPYDVFCAGAKPFITIQNPNASSDRELIVFRDSFGSSIAPLLSNAYSKVTLIDLRYMVPNFAASMADFEGADVLFLYSTGLLNSGRILKDFM